MTPTTPLGGAIFGLVAGLIMVIVVMTALYLPKRRPARVELTSGAWSPDEGPIERP